MAEGRSFRLATEPNLVARHQAFPFQAEAVDFVVAREYAAVFHEQGLGKTKIAIDVALRWLSEEAVDTVLIITKKSLVANWLREFREHTHFTPFVLSEDGRKNYYALTTPTRVAIAHFEVARKEEKRLSIWLKTRRVGVILDEAAKIKNPDAALTQTFFRLSALFTKRVIMTGTPAANRPFDVWAPVYFLDHGATLGDDFAAFQSATDLKREYANDPGALSDYQRRLSAAHTKLAEISVRETKDGSNLSLPAKEYERVLCDWESAQHELYRRVKEDLRATVMKNGVLESDDAEAVLKRLLRLVQICSNPSLVDESYTATPGKYERLYTLISDITGRGEKAIIFTSFVPIADWLARELAPFGALKLTGKMTLDTRNEAIKWFLQNPEDQVLIATTGAAKEGLTLTVANHVIFYDRTYSLDDYLQAQDRIHRISQNRTCYVYNLLMMDSIDEWVDALLEQKKLAAQLIQGDIDEQAYSDTVDFGFAKLLEDILRD
jgi:SNF2 family DNA or RNA helicase